MFKTDKDIALWLRAAKAPAHQSAVPPGKLERARAVNRSYNQLRRALNGRAR
jgi:hypothetical protein